MTTIHSRTSLPCLTGAQAAKLANQKTDKAKEDESKDHKDCIDQEEEDVSPDIELGDEVEAGEDKMTMPPK